MLKARNFMKSQDGFLGIIVLGIGAIIGVVILIEITVLFITNYTKASIIYDRLGAAMDFAVISASMNLPSGTTDNEELNAIGNAETEDEKAFEYFVYSFNQISNSTYSDNEFTVPGLPGNIKILDFYKVDVGDSIPPPRTPLGEPALDAGTAKQPGYVVSAEVPIWQGGIWNIQPISIDMRQYRALQPSPLDE